jgi:hypothetical protein
LHPGRNFARGIFTSISPSVEPISKMPDKGKRQWKYFYVLRVLYRGSRGKLPVCKKLKTGLFCLLGGLPKGVEGKRGFTELPLECYIFV